MHADSVQLWLPGQSEDAASKKVNYLLSSLAAPHHHLYTKASQTQNLLHRAVVLGLAILPSLVPNEPVHGGLAPSTCTVIHITLLDHAGSFFVNVLPCVSNQHLGMLQATHSWPITKVHPINAVGLPGCTAVASPPHQPPGVHFFLKGDNRIVGFCDVPDNTLLVASPPDQGLKERYKGVWALRKKVIVGDTRRVVGKAGVTHHSQGCCCTWLWHSVMADVVDNSCPLLHLFLAQLLEHPPVNIALHLLVISLNFACTDQTFLQLPSNCLCPEPVVHKHRGVLDEWIMELHLLAVGVQVHPLLNQLQLLFFLTRDVLLDLRAFLASGTCSTPARLTNAHLFTFSKSEHPGHPMGNLAWHRRLYHRDLRPTQSMTFPALQHWPALDQIMLSVQHLSCAKPGGEEPQVAAHISVLISTSREEASMLNTNQQVDLSLWSFHLRYVTNLREELLCSRDINTAKCSCDTVHLVGKHPFYVSTPVYQPDPVSKGFQELSCLPCGLQLEHYLVRLPTTCSGKCLLHQVHIAARVEESIAFTLRTVHFHPLHL